MLNTKKAQTLDIVELTEDLPEYDLKRGERGTVVEVFDEPEEAYMLEFVDEAGTSSRLADWVKPTQLVNIYDLAKGMLEQGIKLFNMGKSLEAERIFQQAVDITPHSIDALHNSIMKDLMPSEDYPRLITVLRMLLRLNTEHEVARNNLAIAFQRYGIQKESEGDYNAALELFHLALSIASDLDITSSVKRSFSVVFTSMGIQLYQSSDFLGACKRMRQACEIYPTEVTRRNLMMANAHVAFFHLSRNELEMAKECFERTQDAGLSTPELLNAYGVALARLGHLSDAVWQFRRGLKLSPGDTVIKENLMIINSSLGAGFSTTPISTGFVPVPPMEPQEFQMAA